MSTRAPLAKLATDVLATKTASPIATSAPHARARAIAAIAREIEAAHAARRRKRAIFGLLAVAATIVAVLSGARALRGRRALVARATPSAATSLTTTPTTPTTVIAGAVAHPIAGSVRVVHDGVARPLDNAAALEAGDRLQAQADGRAAVMLPTGTHLVLEGGADVGVVEQGATQVFNVAAGALRIDVAKLVAGRRFVVRTRDAEVEVHGTTFRVSVVVPDPACGHGVATRVSVTEGVVTVRSGGVEAQIASGDSWPAGCDAVASQPRAPSSGAPTAMVSKPPSPATTAAGTAAGASSGAKTAVASAPNDLSAQNDLFAAAMAAKKRGDDAVAIATLDGFLKRYPSSALTENAAVERMRLLAKTNRAGAIAAAKEYRTRYPAGFAQAEAKTLAEGAP